MAIIFKCFVFVRPVSNAFRDLPQLLLQQPHGPGTITPFTVRQTKPQPPILIPPRLQGCLVTVLFRSKRSINAKVSLGPVASRAGMEDVVAVTQGLRLCNALVKGQEKSEGTP